MRVAYVEEPPFYWTAEDGSVTGADVELARVVLGMIGETSIEYVPVAFDELLTGVSEGRWDMNVPIFVTPERERHVTFSVPVWALRDGFVVRRGNPKSLTSYSSVRSDGTARLGLIPGQVQFDAARAFAANTPELESVAFPESGATWGRMTTVPEWRNTVLCAKKSKERSARRSSGE
jgi:polar amino acid transport system substrate-binding protein